MLHAIEQAIGGNITVMAQTALGAAKAAAANAGLTLSEFQARIAAGLKRCTCCKEWHPRASFNVDRSRSDGLTAKCHGCTRVKVRVCTKGRPSGFAGNTHTPEARAKQSAARRQRPGPNPGVPRPLEVRAKISATLRVTAARGPAAPGYIDGKGVERQGERTSEKAKRWRYDVMSRDRFHCVHCGDDEGGNLVAHHKKHWATHPELRFDVSNGVTLCDGCHHLAHHI